MFFPMHPGSCRSNSGENSYHHFVKQYLTMRYTNELTDICTLNDLSIYSYELYTPKTIKITNMTP